MEFLPVQILEENDACKKLLNQHIYTIRDLQNLLNSKAEGGLALSKEVERILEDKIAKICKGIREGVDTPRNGQFADKFHSLANNLMTLNGINLICGKRGSGKTTFAFSQMLDAYLELNALGIKMYLKEQISDVDFVVLRNLKIFFFCMREVFFFTHFNGLIEEKSRKFIEKNLDGKLPSATVETYVAKLNELVRFAIAIVYPMSFEEHRNLFAQMLMVSETSSAFDIFGVIIDDLSFLFNKVDSLTIKSEVRNISKLLNQLIRQNNVPVVVTDSVRAFYEEDSIDDLKLFTPNIFFTSVSDIVYLTRSDTMFKVVQAKSSRELISVESFK